MSHLMSPEYLQLCQQMHEQEPWGTKGFSYAGDVLRLIDGHKCSTILDYGCGKDSLRRVIERDRPFVDFRSYDPAIPEFAHVPLPAHLVVCTDVMEHVEESYVVATLRNIAWLTEKLAFFSIALLPARQILPNGKNAHVTVKPIDWWVTAFHAAGQTKLAWTPGKKRLILTMLKETA